MYVPGTLGPGTAHRGTGPCRQHGLVRDRNRGLRIFQLCLLIGGRPRLSCCCWGQQTQVLYHCTQPGTGALWGLKVLGASQVTSLVLPDAKASSFHQGHLRAQPCDCVSPAHPIPREACRLDFTSLEKPTPAASGHPHSSCLETDLAILPVAHVGHRR